MKDAMYSSSVQVFLRCLNAMDAVLDKGAAFAEGKKVDMGVLLGMRLAPDMFPLMRQVQLVSDFAKGISARLAGVENPKYEDNEATLDELRARIRKTLEFVQSVPADKVDGSEQREIVVPLRNGELKFTGEGYLKHYAMPNFYFHCTTAYALLRHAGVDIGKVDYIGAAG